MAYVKSSEKAKEFKSGGVSLLIVGCIGFIGVLLVLFNVIPMRMNLFSKYLILGVMGTLFLLFIIMGILSFKSYKKFELRAGDEDNLTSKLLQWCNENLTAEAIDAAFEPMTDAEEPLSAEEEAGEEDSEALDETEEEEPMPETEEMKYFRRCERMKTMISAKFMNLDEAFLDSFVDDIYQNIFS